MATDMSNRETDVEMNNTGTAKVANNSGSNDGAAPTPVELQGYDASDGVMRGINRLHSSFIFQDNYLDLLDLIPLIFTDESMSKLKNKKTANNASTTVPANSTKKRPDELVLDMDCRKKAKDDDTIRYKFLNN